MHSHPLLAALEATTAARLAHLIDTTFGAVQQLAPTAPAALGAYRFVAEADAFREFAAERGAWASRAFLCCFDGTRRVSAQRLLQSGCEWVGEDLRVEGGSRELEVNELVELLQGLDAVLVFQAAADVECLSAALPRPLAPDEHDRLDRELLRTYRERHIATGFHRREFFLLLHAFLTKDQRSRLLSELAPILAPNRRVPCLSSRPSHPLSHALQL